MAPASWSSAPALASFPHAPLTETATARARSLLGAGVEFARLTSRSFVDSSERVRRSQVAIDGQQSEEPHNADTQRQREVGGRFKEWPGELQRCHGPCRAI